MKIGDRVVPTEEAIKERAFGFLYRGVPFDPGEGVVISMMAPIQACVIVSFQTGNRMVHPYWLRTPQPQLNQ